MNNPDSRTCSGLRLDCGCQPDPVSPAGATHHTTITNIGNDRYTVDLELRIMSGSRPGASLALHDNVRQVDVIRWFAGTFGPGRSAAWPQVVERCPAGTAKGHGIRTTAEYVSEAERDPLDDEATVPYTCACIVDVSVL